MIYELRPRSIRPVAKIMIIFSIKQKRNRFKWALDQWSLKCSDQTKSVKKVDRLNLIDGTVNTDKFLDILEESLLPAMEKALDNGEDFTFQQDSADCHTL